VPSDEELWELARKVKKQVTPHFNWSTWDEPHGPDFGHFVAAHRALHDCGYEQGLAAGRAEQGGTPEPEPSQAPAGDGRLVDTISDIIENEPIIGRPPEEKWKPEARAVLLAVAKWLRGEGHSYYFAAELEREANR
jgi:hypothetical protein